METHIEGQCSNLNSQMKPKITPLLILNIKTWGYVQTS